MAGAGPQRGIAPGEQMGGMAALVEKRGALRRFLEDGGE